MFDLEKIRQDFPVLGERVYGRKLAYLDNAATTQKPLAVIDKEREIYEKCNSNIHRGVHKLSNLCTEMYESARERVRSFVKAKSASEIIFTSGTTASVNLVAYSFSEKYLKPGDEILVSESEHHSNLVPWQQICFRKGAKIRMLPFDEEGCLRIDLLDELLNERTKLLAVAQVSNVLGTVNPLDTIVKIAHRHGVPVFVDGAQGVQHADIDLVASDFDFYAFSGHKIYGPTGIGVLYGKERLLEELPPWQYGGDMVSSVSFAETRFAELPLKFEAGTANYVGATALGEALDYLDKLGRDKIHAREMELNDYAFTALSKVPGIRIFGTAKDKTGIASFLLDGVHPADAGEILDKMGIAVRVGQLCAEPVMRHYGINGLVRASWVFYNTYSEIDALIEGLDKVRKMVLD
ncbi:MAG: SufS family cysteine desulfurase [Prevotellaceae bacterium]|jgi:cysteine desulfurase/selenocysteine lyase|nr:SufS family cysteine desulfurase [Prevotellaceae bacterium]